MPIGQLVSKTTFWGPAPLQFGKAKTPKIRRDFEQL